MGIEWMRMCLMAALIPSTMELKHILPMMKATFKFIVEMFPLSEKKCALVPRRDILALQRLFNKSKLDQGPIKEILEQLCVLGEKPKLRSRKEHETYEKLREDS